MAKFGVSSTLIPSVSVKLMCIVSHLAPAVSRDEMTGMSSSANLTPYTNLSTQSNNRGGEEDWSRISDYDQRRRVQNRIAQRKFRTSCSIISLL